MIKQTYPDGSISDRTYHATGALNELKLDSSTVSTRTYDAGRRLTSDALGNGITETRTYSNDNLLTAINYSNTSLGDLTYTWDTNKNKTSESISGVMSGYGFTNAGTTYDDEDRLTGYQRTNGALSQSWNLTSVGDWNSVTTNGTAQSRTHGPTHELLTAGGQTVNTDVKGNITLLPTALSSLASTALGMSWDFDNKLTSVDVGNDSSTDVEYKYDALGRRVARVGSSGSFVYVQSDQQTIADYGVGDAPSSPLYRYVYASYIDEPVVRKGAGTGGTIHYYHRNQQYSITAITTSAGAIAERYAYSAYGEPTICDASGSQISNSSISNRYSYTGREWDETVGLYHFRARWMSPKTGRFLGRDPIGFEGGAFNISEYCHDSPFNYIDPSGQQIRPNPAVPWAPYPYPSSPLPPPSQPQPAPPPVPATPQPPSTTPPPRAEYCGPLRMKCPPPVDIDNVEASVIGNSHRAAAILAMGGMTGGCVTFPSGIECTMSCQALKTTMSGDNPKQLILAHEACHYCALKLLTGTRCGEAGLLPFLGTITPAPDPCVGRERPITIGWR